MSIMCPPRDGLVEDSLSQESSVNFNVPNPEDDSIVIQDNDLSKKQEDYSYDEDSALDTSSCCEGGALVTLDKPEDSAEKNESSSIVMEKDVYDDTFVRESTYVENRLGIIIGASLRGRSHKDSGTECQDYHLYSQLGEGWHVLIVADGAGSAKYAGRGSKGNCIIALHLLSQLVTENHWIDGEVFPSELEWYIQCRSIFEQMKLIYRGKVSEMNDGTKESDFNATIVLCLLTPKGMLTAHIGDGRMGYLSKEGDWRSLMTPHKGEEANQTLFLQNTWTTPQVPAFKVSGVFVPETHVVKDIPQAVILMSDGCEKASWECVMYSDITGKYEDVNRPHPEFMNPLIDAILEEKADERLSLLIDIMDRGTKVCEQERDDKTMLLTIITYEENGDISGND